VPSIDYPFGSAARIVVWGSNTASAWLLHSLGVGVAFRLNNKRYPCPIEAAESGPTKYLAALAGRSVHGLDLYVS
jgi:hypothetical protein